MNGEFTFSANNWCWCIIIDQTFSNARDKQWTNFQLTTAIVSCEILTSTLLLLLDMNLLYIVSVTLTLITGMLRSQFIVLITQQVLHCKDLLIHFKPVLHFYTPENVSKPKVFWYFQGYKNGTLAWIGLMWS